MAYLLLDTSFEPANFGASCGPDFINWTTGLLGIQLESISTFGRATKPSQDRMLCMNLVNRVIPPAHSERYSGQVCRWWKHVCFPLAADWCQKHSDPLRHTRERQRAGARGRGKSRVQSISPSGICQTLKSCFPCSSQPHRKASGWVAVELELCILKCLPRWGGRSCTFCWLSLSENRGLSLEKLFKPETAWEFQCVRQLICWWWQLIWQWPVI